MMIASSFSKQSSPYVAIALAAFFFCSSLFVYSRHNNFPFYLHPDERGKAAQVLDNVRNFHHPLLMLTVASQTTHIVKDYINRKPTYQETVVIGRWIAAVFMSGGVAILCLTLLRTVGLYAALTLGVILTFDPTLFLVSHFMKEDPTLFFSLSLLYLTFTYFNRQPNLRNVLLFGAAAGLVAASKYTGLISLAIIYPMLALRLLEDKKDPSKQALALGRGIGFFTLTLLGVFFIFNYPMIIEASKFLAGFGRELTEVTVGQHGVRKTEVPHLFYGKYLMRDYPISYWLVVAGFLYYVLRMPGPMRREHVFPMLVVTALLLMISFSPKISERYLMPTEIFILVIMASAAGFIFKIQFSRFKLGGPLLALFITTFVIYVQWTGHPPGRMGWKETKESFKTNSYEELHDWIRDHIPAKAVLLQPEKRFLPDPEIGFFDDVPKDLPQKIYSQSTFVKSGSLASAREAGVTHVIVLHGTTKKYEGKIVSATDKAREDRRRRSGFFNDLRKTSHLVYKIPPEKNLLLHPGFEVYQLD